MKTLQLPTQHPYYRYTEGSYNYLPSMTVPDDSMSLTDILQRFAAGLPINGNNQEQFYEEDELPDLRTMDLEEIAMMKIKNDEDIARHRENLQNAHNKKERQRIIDDYEKSKPPVPAVPAPPSGAGAGA